MSIFKRIFCIFLFAAPAFLFAQDTIFTKGGDTICCEITKIDESNIYFNVTELNKNRSMLLSLKGMIDYRSKKPIEIDNKKNKYPNFRCAFEGGLSYRTKKIKDDVPQEFKDFYSKLNSGYQYGIGVQYFAAKNLGFGLKYSHFRSKNAMKYYIEYYGKWDQYIQNEDINIDFIGPTINIRSMHNKNRNSFTGYASLGYLHYIDQVLSHGITATGSTFGLAFGFNYDIKVAENLAIGLDISYILGTLTKCKISDGISSETIELDNNNNLHHLNFSIGLRLIK